MLKICFWKLLSNSSRIRVLLIYSKIQQTICLNCPVQKVHTMGDHNILIPFGIQCLEWFSDFATHCKIRKKAPDTESQKALGLHYIPLTKIYYHQQGSTPITLVYNPSTSRSGKELMLLLSQLTGHSFFTNRDYIYVPVNNYTRTEEGRPVTHGHACSKHMFVTFFNRIELPYWRSALQMYLHFSDT